MLSNTSASASACWLRSVHKAAGAALQQCAQSLFG